MSQYHRVCQSEDLSSRYKLNDHYLKNQRLIQVYSEFFLSNHLEVLQLQFTHIVTDLNSSESEGRNRISKLNQLESYRYRLNIYNVYKTLKWAIYARITGIKLSEEMELITSTD